MIFSFCLAKVNLASCDILLKIGLYIKFRAKNNSPKPRFSWKFAIYLHEVNERQFNYQVKYN